MKRTLLRYAMLGGAKGAFIGNVHKHAIDYCEMAQLTAGCFSSREAVNKSTGDFYGLAEDRIYSNYKELLEKEATREDKIDFVCICTPNYLHYEMSKAALEAGFSVVCEKPLCFAVEEAKELQDLADKKGLLFGVTYTYTGYAMVKFAKELIEKGTIGTVINVNAEYLQDWLLEEVEKTDNKEEKLSAWRMDPAISGGSNCVGDIGSHIEATVSYITGLRVKKLCAVLDRYGKALDLNANILVELENGCHGVYSSSQITAGHYNGLVVRIFGTNGAIEWVQEKPDFLNVTIKGEPTRTYSRGASGVFGVASQVSHIPSGHPEGLTLAFANIYYSYMSALLKRLNGEELSDCDLDFPNAEFGVEGVKFIQGCLESDRSNNTWIEL